LGLGVHFEVFLTLINWFIIVFCFESNLNVYVYLFLHFSYFDYLDAKIIFLAI